MGASLRRVIGAGDIVVAPGIYDALGGLLAEKTGFSAAYLSGASIAYSRFGRPDIGLVTQTEVAETLSAITERIEIPVIVDADTGFGNALNVIRTVKLLERRSLSEPPYGLPVSAFAETYNVYGLGAGMAEESAPELVQLFLRAVCEVACPISRLQCHVDRDVYSAQIPRLHPSEVLTILESVELR